MRREYKGESAWEEGDGGLGRDTLALNIALNTFGTCFWTRLTNIFQAVCDRATQTLKHVHLLPRGSHTCLAWLLGVSGGGSVIEAHLARTMA